MIHHEYQPENFIPPDVLRHQEIIPLELYLKRRKLLNQIFDLLKNRAKVDPESFEFRENEHVLEQAVHRFIVMSRPFFVRNAFQVLPEFEAGSVTREDLVQQMQLFTLTTLLAERVLTTDKKKFMATVHQSTLRDISQFIATSQDEAIELEAPSDEDDLLEHMFAQNILEAFLDQAGRAAEANDVSIDTVNTIFKKTLLRLERIGLT